MRKKHLFVVIDRSVRRKPAPLALLGLSCALLLMLWTFARASHLSALADRAEDNLKQAEAADRLLRRLTPPHMPRAGSHMLVERIEQRLRNAGAISVINSVGDQLLGSVGDLPSTRYQTRVELSKISFLQAAAAIDGAESSGLPCWVESLDLSATGEGDEWSMVMQVNWIALPSSNPPVPDVATVAGR